MLRKLSWTGATCLNKKTTLMLCQVVAGKSTTFSGLYNTYGSDFRFAPKFSPPSPVQLRSLYTIKPLQFGLLHQIEKATITTLPDRFGQFKALQSRKRFNDKNSERTASYNDDDDDDDDERSPYKTRTKPKCNYNIAFLKDDSDDDDDENKLNAAAHENPNVALWEKAIKANKEWEKQQKLEAEKQQQQQVPEYSYQKQQQYHHQQQQQKQQQWNKVKSHEKNDEQRLMQMKALMKPLKPFQPKMLSSSSRGKKPDDRNEMKTAPNRNIDPDFVIHLQEQERVTRNQERLQNLMNLHQQQLDDQLAASSNPSKSDSSTTVWAKVLPSDLGKYQFAESRYMSQKGQKSSCHKRREFDFPTYTPSNENSDNADVRAKKQQMEHSSRKNAESDSSVVAIHRARAAELDSLACSQGAIKESAIYRLCNQNKPQKAGNHPKIKYNNPRDKKSY